MWFSFLHLAFWGLYGWFVGEAGQGFVAFCCMVSAKCSLVFSVEPVASQSGRDLTSQVVLTSHSALLCWTFGWTLRAAPRLPDWATEAHNWKCPLAAMPTICRCSISRSGISGEKCRGIEWPFTFGASWPNPVFASMRLFLHMAVHVYCYFIYISGGDMSPPLCCLYAPLGTVGSIPFDSRLYRWSTRCKLQ